MPQMMKDPRYEENVRREEAEEQLHHEQQETTHQREPESSFETLERFCEEDRARAAEAATESEQLCSFPISVNRDVEAELLEEEAKTDMPASADASETPEHIKSVVQEINRLAIKTIEQGAMEIGEYVLDAVFDGNLDAVHSRNPYKSQSLQQVCEDPELLIDRRRLGMWVKAAAFKRDLQAKGVECSNLSYSRLAALLRVNDEKKRRELAAEANRNGWSVRQINSRIEKMQPQKGANGRAKELLNKMKDPLGLLEDEATRQLLDSPEELEQELKSKDRIEMVQLIDDTVAKMVNSTDLLQRTKKTLVRIELGDALSAED